MPTFCFRYGSPNSDVGLNIHAQPFLIAVHHHFEQMFIRHAHEHESPHPDVWTLNYLSRVICGLVLHVAQAPELTCCFILVYPAIGDAIDEGRLASSLEVVSFKLLAHHHPLPRQTLLDMSHYMN